MKIFTTKLSSTASKRVSNLLLIFILVLTSCSHDLDTIEQAKSYDSIKKVKEYVESSNFKFSFFKPDKTKSNTDYFDTNLDWENCHTQEHENVVYVEIPFNNNLFNLATDKNGENYKVATRLIVMHNYVENFFKEFIITKILKEEDNNIANVSFDDLNINSYTILYKLDGETITQYETTNGKIKILISGNESAKTEFKEFIINQEKYCFVNNNKLQTKSQWGTCEYCYYRLQNYVCLKYGRIATDINYMFFFEK